ncbi:hypothetical protein WA538_000798 [Blastocystis sp. DL]
MLKTIQNATFRRSAVPFLRGAPRLSARRLSLSMPIIDTLNTTILYRAPDSLISGTDYVSLKPSSKFRRTVFNKLSAEYDRFNLEAMRPYDYLSRAEQHKLDMVIRAMLDDYNCCNFLGVITEYNTITVPVSPVIHQMVFCSLFHMDMFPRIPSSFLVKLVELSKMECNATPIDLSPIQEQLKSYLPVVARIGNRHDFSQVILKLLFLSVMLSIVVSTQKNSLKSIKDTSYIPEKDIKTRFSDVVGLGENMDELRLMVEFLQNPQKFSFIGAKSPRGVLFTGPPGTGKTLLARAVAGEAGVPFYFVAGSEFDEVLVGVGAKRVRALFEKARETAPCIVFIDELDAVGGKRDEVGGTNNSRQTINQLLNEIGGFRGDEGILVIAATNLADSLDPALVRAGRFDLQVQTHLPDLAARETLLKKLAAKHRLAPDVSLAQLAQRSVGCSGAQLESLLSVATMKALTEGANLVEKRHIEEAWERVTMGVRRPGVQEAAVRHETAVHECGHAVMAMLIDDYPQVDKITIVPRGDALGYVSNVLDERFLYSMTKRDIINRIDVALGGRAAEELILGEDAISTGASNDLEKASNYALSMAYQWGMTECGLRADPSPQNPYSSKLPFYSQTTIAENDEIIDALLRERYAAVKRLLAEHKSELLRLVEYVEERETVTGANARRVMAGEAPVEDAPSVAQLAQQKELGEAYTQLSLVDSYRVRDGRLVARVGEEEVRDVFLEGYTRVIERLKGEIEKGGEEAAHAEKILRMLGKFDVRDRKIVLDKYTALLFQHSLDSVNVEEVMEKVKKEVEERNAKQNV